MCLDFIQDLTSPNLQIVLIIVHKYNIDAAKCTEST